MMIFWVIFWGIFLFTTANLFFGSERDAHIAALPVWLQLLTSPFMLLIIWITALKYRAFFVILLDKVHLPPFLKFFLFGAPLGALTVGFTVAFGLSSDLDPNPVVNTLLYIGPWGGMISGWYALRRFYVFDYRHVFWISGVYGAIVEQGFIMPLALLSGNIVGALLLTAYLIPSYGVATALMFIIMSQKELPQGTRAPGLLGYLLFFVVPVVAFYIGAVIWYYPLGLLLGKNFISG